MFTKTKDNVASERDRYIFLRDRTADADRATTLHYQPMGNHINLSI